MGRHDPSPDPKVLGRVRALLAKAESTSFPEEAESLTAKAQELMARYSIDAAMAEAGRGGHEKPSSVRLDVPSPYVSAKVQLVTAVARSNRCQAVWSKGPGDDHVVVFGFPVDLEAVELLFTSLLLQATAAALSAGAQVDAWGRSRTRSFRAAFLVSFAVRIGERLREAAEAAVDEATADHAAACGDAGPALLPALLPVLADRADAVLAARDAQFPNLRASAVRVSNGAGWSAGRKAANSATLPTKGQVPGRSPGRLGR